MTTDTPQGEYAELMKRLRGDGFGGRLDDWTDYVDMHEEAASAIEALTERVRELETKCSNLDIRLISRDVDYRAAKAREKIARNAALEEAAKIAQRSLDAEERFFRNNGENFGHQMEASGGMDIAEEIRDVIRSLQTKEE